jgi:biopolymer transport protein ExbD
MKYFSLVIFLILFSCGEKKDVLLPKSNLTIVSDVKDHSPIYIFFKTQGKDTLAEVNRNNAISSTNEIFNIDKRLPLRLVIPEVMKLQEKKRNSAHKNEAAENYYSYADSIGKNMAFLPFTKVHYKMGKPLSSFIVFFSKKNQIFVDGTPGNREELKHFLNSFKDKTNIIRFGFDENMSYATYIQNEIFIQSIKIQNKEEFIY